MSARDVSRGSRRRTRRASLDDDDDDDYNRMGYHNKKGNKSAASIGARDRDRCDNDRQRSSHSPFHPHHDRKRRRKTRTYEKKRSKKKSRNYCDDDGDVYYSPSRRSKSYDDHYHNSRRDDRGNDHRSRSSSNDSRCYHSRRGSNRHERRIDRSSRRRRRQRRRRRTPSTEKYPWRDAMLHRHPEIQGHQAGAADFRPRAGVVSDDDDSSRKYAVQQSTAQTMANRNSSKSNNSKKRKSSPNIQDDTIGHFKGREGCVVADRYRILKEVGVGTFGRVVECLDIKRRRGRQGRDGHYRQENENIQDRHQRKSRQHDQSHHEDNPNNIVAIKIVRNVKRYYDSAIIEADIIEDVNRRGRRGLTHCAVMYDAFSFHGHYCMVFECLGPSLYDFLKKQKYHPFPIHCVRDFAKQLLECLEFLHSFRLIHTDLKPENILLLNGREVPQRGGYSVPESTRIKVIDFGGATYDNEKKSSIVNTRQYRAPEVILGVGWSMPSDLWSIGCILAELYQGELLFATHDNIEHLALIEQVIGPFPKRMLKRAKNAELVNEAFDSNGLHRMDRVLPADKLSYVKRIAPLESIVYDEDAWFLRLLRRILVIDPNERATARECLRKF